MNKGSEVILQLAEFVKQDHVDEKVFIDISNTVIQYIENSDTLEQEVLSLYGTATAKMPDSFKVTNLLLHLLKSIEKKHVSASNLHLIQITSRRLAKSSSLKNENTSTSIKEIIQNTEVYSMETNIKLQYIQLQLSLLRTLTNDHNYILSHLKDIVEGFTSSSSFFRCLTSLYPEASPEYFQLTSTFIKLSLSVKTIHRLVFLIAAAHYSVYTGKPKHELFTRITKEGLKMYQKSKLMVHKFAAVPLFQLIAICNEKNLDVSSIEILAKQFRAEESQKPSIKNCNDLNNNTNELLQPLKNMTLQESLVALMRSSSIEKLLTSKQFIQNVKTTIKCTDFDDPQNEDLIADVIKFLIPDKTNNKAILGLFDDLVIRFKTMKLTTDNAKFIHTSIAAIARYMTTAHERKRSNNCSKLLFYFGNSLLKLDSEMSLPFWKSFIFCENELSSSKEEQLLTLKRLNFVSSSEVLAQNFNVALTIQLMFMNDVVDSSMDPYACDKLLKEEFQSSSKIITRCILSNVSLIGEIFEQIQSESLIVAINLFLIDAIEGTKIPMKEQLISKIIIIQKENTMDSGLFFYFLSNVSFLISFPINFKVGSLYFNSDSCIYNLQSLVTSHLHILQSFTATDNISESILKSYYLMSQWLQTDAQFSNYEFQIVETLFQTMKYHELYKYAAELVQSYVNCRKEDLDDEKSALMLSYLVECYIKLDQYNSCEDIIKKNEHFVNKKIESYQDMEFLLRILEYYIITNNPESENLVLKLYTTLECKIDFNISKQRDKYNAVHILLLHAKFCQSIAGLYKSDILRSITNLNRSITILQSVFKNFLLTGPNVPSLNTNFKYLLKMKFSYMMLECYNSIIQKYATVGFGKEFDYYFKELDVFINVQPSINLQYYYNLKLMEFSLVKNALNKASQYYEVVKERKKSTISDDNILIEIYSLVVFENYARKSKDAELVKVVSHKLDNVIFNFLKVTSAVSFEYTSVIAKWIEALKRRYQYLCKGELDDYKLVIDSNIKNIVEYHNCLRDLQAKSQTNAVSFYPIVESSSLKSYTDHEFEKLKACNQNFTFDFESTVNADSVEVTKYTLDMIITSFVNMLRYDKSVKINDELAKLVTVNDKFKYCSFYLEKQFALANFKKNSILPELPDKFTNVNKTKSRDFDLRGILPANWSVISIDYVSPINSFMITKYSNEFEEPLFINISLDKHDLSKSFESTLKSLKHIIEESDKSTQFEVTSKIKTDEQKLEWWDTRKALDNQLQNLLSNIDECWFGGFNSIFQTNKCTSAEVEMIKSNIKKALVDKLKVHKETIDGLELLHPNVFELFLKIDGLTKEKVQDLLKFLLDSVDSESSGMNTLIADAAQELKRDIQNIKKQQKKDSEKSHIVLIPGGKCTDIPWESIPSLRNKSVTRMPTVLQLRQYLSKYKHLLDNGINTDKGYYVINPGGDLKRTEENLSPKFNCLNGWSGVIGIPPTETELMKAFDEANLYMYAGHGGGEQYIRSKTIKARENIPPSLLLGCSSGSLKGEGFVHPYGTAYNFINGGCPMLLVNLWDVTDKDIDLFTINALTKWGFLVDYDSFDPFDLNIESISLAECVTKSRDVCKLKYLNGAAPIIYGLPLSLETN